jgi:hypothetical protein
MIVKKFGNKMGIEHDVFKFVGVYGILFFKNESNNFAKNTLYKMFKLYKLKHLKSQDFVLLIVSFC